MKINSVPAQDGFYMPAEFEAHEGCIMIWPKRPGSWNYGAVEARKAFAEVAKAIGESEHVFMLAEEDVVDNAREAFADVDCVTVIPMESDDAWARDVGPTFVVDGKGNRRGIDWQFNAWGGTYDGLYASWKKDDAVAGNFCTICGIDSYCAQHLVLEGGSIHSDGEGTVMVTESCLLSGGRNPHLSKDEIEEQLKLYLGAEKVLWLPRGIYNDETNEHVDNVCAFTAPGEVVLAWTEDKEDPQYELSKACLDYLNSEVDAKGRGIQVQKLLIPKKPILITQYDLDGYEFEEGEDEREVGERLAASYVNFYISNGGVVVPQFGDEHDVVALDVLRKCFPTRKIIPIEARTILVGGGNIHCITQQIPQAKDKI